MLARGVAVMTEYKITVVHSTSGKELVLAVEPQFTVASLLEVLVENLQLKDRFVLATQDNKLLNPDVTLQDAGVAEGGRLILMPDPTGGREAAVVKAGRFDLDEFLGCCKGLDAKKEYARIKAERVR